MPSSYLQKIISWEQLSLDLEVNVDSIPVLRIYIAVTINKLYYYLCLKFLCDKFLLPHVNFLTMNQTTVCCRRGLLVAMAKIFMRCNNTDMIQYFKWLIIIPRVHNIYVANSGIYLTEKSLHDTQCCIANQYIAMLLQVFCLINTYHICTHIHCNKDMIVFRIC